MYFPFQLRNVQYIPLVSGIVVVFNKFPYYIVLLLVKYVCMVLVFVHPNYLGPQNFSLQQ